MVEGVSLHERLANTNFEPHCCPHILHLPISAPFCELLGRQRRSTITTGGYCLRIARVQRGLRRPGTHIPRRPSKMVGTFHKVPKEMLPDAVQI